MNIKRCLRKCLLIVAIVVVFNSNFIYGQIHRPFITIPFTSSPPVIDGTLDDVTWQKSYELSEFVNWGLENYLNDSVTVFLCYDTFNIYIAFRNSDPEASNLNESVPSKRPWDTGLWSTNTTLVEIGYKQNNVQLLADPKETMTDFRNSDISWNGNWKFKVSINKNDWTAEYSIPLDEIGIIGSPVNCEIGMTLTRSFPAGESASWIGACKLSDFDALRCSYGGWPQPVPGENHLAVEFYNSSTEDQIVNCEFQITPLEGKPEFINQSGLNQSSNLRISVNKEPIVIKKKYVVRSGEKRKEKIAYNLPSEGSYYASGVFKTNDDLLIRRIHDFWFTIEPNGEKIKKLELTLGECFASMARISNSVVDSLKHEAIILEKDIQQLNNSIDSAWKTGQWSNLTSEVAKKEDFVAQFLHEVKWTALHNWKEIDDFGIACTHSILKLRRDALFPGPLNEILELSVAQNEYESVQLAILPFGKDLNHLVVDISDLKNANGEIISKKDIELSLVDYNKIDWQPQYVIDYKGWYPDPLIPLGKEININGSELCRPIWITVFAAPGTEGGDYTGTVTIRAAGLKEITATVKCRVWNFKVPLESHLKTHTWDYNNIARFYNLEEVPVEWYQRICGLLLKNRLNPGFAGINFVNKTPDNEGRYDFSNVEKVLKYSIDRGITRFSIMQMKKGIYTKEEGEANYKFIAAYAKFLRERGWLDNALIELWDEPSSLEWPMIKDRAERIKAIDPGLKLQLFAEGGPYNFWEKNTDQYGLNDLIDIWAPLSVVESPEIQAKGTEIWSYFCTLANGNAPNFYIERPAIYQRNIAWYCWMYGLDGFEHWGIDYFWRNNHSGKPMNEKWPNVPWDSRSYHYFDGEGQLFYPGPDGVPFSSIRLENFRDGMEDYEYLYMLKELLVKFEKDSADTEINSFRQLLNAEDYLLYKYPRTKKLTFENTMRYPDEPEKFLYARKEIALAIEKLQIRLDEKKK